MSSISVLMPARNEERTISKSVRSVLRQLRAGDELLIYDDASVDKTPQILKRIESPFLRVITGRRQIGTSAAANLLNREASNSIVAKLDADDFALPGRFDYQRKILEKQNIDFHFGCSLLLRGKIMLPQPPKRLNPQQIRVILPFDNPLTNSTMMSRKEAISSLGGYPEGAQQDYSLWLRAALAGAKMVRTSRYLAVREIPIQKHKSEARNKPVAAQLSRERIALYRQLLLSGDIAGSANQTDKDIWSDILSKKTHSSATVEKISRLFS